MHCEEVQSAYLAVLVDRHPLFEENCILLYEGILFFSLRFVILISEFILSYSILQ